MTLFVDITPDEAGGGAERTSPGGSSRARSLLTRVGLPLLSVVLFAEGGGGRAELTGVGTEQRLDAPDDLVPVGGAPQQRPQPQPGQTGIEVVPRPRGQQRGEDRGVDRRPADEDRCGEEVEIGAGQVVERPGQARRRRRAGGEGRHVGRRRTGEVRAVEQEGRELGVGPAAQVLREVPHPVRSIRPR